MLLVGLCHHIYVINHTLLDRALGEHVGHVSRSGEKAHALGSRFTTFPKASSAMAIMFEADISQKLYSSKAFKEE